MFETKAAPKEETTETAKRAAKSRRVAKAPKPKGTPRVTPSQLASMSLASIQDKQLIEFIKGKKRAASVRTISQHFKCVLNTAKRSVLRLMERHPHLRIRVVVQREGERGSLSECYYIEG